MGRSENDPVAGSRKFLIWAVHDAVERGELTAGIQVAPLAEALLLVLCGVGFYAGFVGSYREMADIIAALRQLMAGTLWKSEA